MKRVLLTGMSGTGKSTVTAALAERGYTAVDADEGGFSILADVDGDDPDTLGPGKDWIWHEGRIRELLDRDDADVLFVGGCAPNQGTFHARFDHIILLTAPPAVLVERLVTRTNNPYGKRPGEVARVLRLQQAIEPLLRRSARHIIDTSAPLDQVVASVLRIAGLPG